MIRKIFLEKSSYFFIALGLISLSSCSKFGRLSDSEKVTKVTIGSGSSYSKQHPRASQNGGVFVWGISSDEKFSFFLNTISRKKRFSKWHKKDADTESFRLVQEYFGYSNEKTKEALSILTEDQLTMIKEKLFKGGK